MPASQAVAERVLVVALRPWTRRLAFESVLREGLGTRDVGGPSSTSEFTAAVLAAIDDLYAADSLDAGTSGKPAAAAASSS